MTLTTGKLNELYTNLWGPHNPLSQSGNTYAVILMCEHTQKTWTLYLRGKNNFINAFQAWLPQAEAEYKYLMKTLRTDGGGEFSLDKFQVFYEKKDILIKYAALYVHKKNGLAKWG